MITLLKHGLHANISNRYCKTKYSFDFVNENETATELKFDITIDPDAFISEFQANIDGVLFIGQTKEKQTAAKEYSAAKEKDENAILISQPHRDIPNIFQIKTNIDSKSKISLEISIEQYLKKKFNFNELTIQILRNWSKYNIDPNYECIDFIFNVFDECGIYDISIPSAMNVNNEQLQTCIIDEHNLNQTEQKCVIKGKLMRNIPNQSQLCSNAKNKWIDELKIGNKLDVQCGNKWYESEVIAIDEHQLGIHYIGWSSKYDKNIDLRISRHRLAPLGTHTHNPALTNELTLKYKVKGASMGSHILFDNNSSTFCHIISNTFDSNPSNEGNNNFIPRRVIFVIDKSGSMGGTKWSKTVTAAVID